MQVPVGLVEEKKAVAAAVERSGLVLGDLEAHRYVV